uniref:Uncharacterized protein n=1 Tax=Parascaris univalens TaxID=6257 RepID=A0A914ZXI6_PARUN
MTLENRANLWLMLEENHCGQNQAADFVRLVEFDVVLPPGVFGGNFWEHINTTQLEEDAVMKVCLQKLPVPFQLHEAHTPLIIYGTDETA